MESDKGRAASCLDMNLVFAPYLMGAPSEDVCKKYIQKQGGSVWVCARLFASVVPSITPGSTKYNAVCAWINSLERYYRSKGCAPYHPVDDGIADFLGETRDELMLCDMLEAARGRYFIPCIVKKPDDYTQAIIRFNPDRKLPSPEEAVLEWVQQNMWLFSCTQESVRGVNMHDTSHLATPFKVAAHKILTGCDMVTRVIFHPSVYPGGRMERVKIMHALRGFLYDPCKNTLNQQRYKSVMEYCMEGYSKRGQVDISEMVRVFMQLDGNNIYLDHSLFQIMRLLEVEAAIVRVMYSEPGATLVPTNSAETFVDTIM